MSQSTLSDQSLSQGQGADMNGNDIAFQQIVTERNSLRAQNDQLWKIIEKQRIIIQNLQKDVAKATTERDLLRHLAVENGLTLNGQPIQSSKRSMERKNQQHPHQSSSSSSHSRHNQQHHLSQEQQQDAEVASISSDTSHVQSERDTTHAAMPPHSVTSVASSSAAASIDSRRSLEQHHPQSPVKPRQDSGPKVLLASPMENEVHTETASETEIQLLVAQDDGSASQESYDPEVQVATAASRVHHQGSASTPLPSHNETDIRASPLRTEFSSGATLSPLPSPIAGRNISAPISLAHMPHLPPRSPRRERRDHDNTSSPPVSDNEDDSFQSQGGRRKGATSGPITIPARFTSQIQSAPDDQDSQVMSVSKVSMKQVNAYEQQVPSFSENEYSPQPAKASMVTRKTVSAQIPAIPSTLSPQTTSQELNIPSSPVSSLNSATAPASPITAIIDQDAEKFRVYMNKLNTPRKMASAPIQVPVEMPEHAAALGQAVALENIQNQIEIQNQLMGQVQGHGGRGLTPVVQNGRSSNSMDGGESQPLEHSDTVESSHRRRASLQEDYPAISARSTSHSREEDDSYNTPQLPRRYDSQTLEQSSDIHYMRVASPTPSGNSSVTNTLSSGQPPLSHSRSMPTFHQQAFSMFSDNLEFVSILVVGSNITTNDKGKEQLTFVVSIGQETQSPNSDAMVPHKEQEELWRVEKQYHEFVNLDSKLRVTQSRNIVNSLPKLPDKSLFTTHAPSKVDARKVALEQYLQQVTSLRIKDTRDLCEFLSTNVVERERRREGNDAGWKEGYLTKRGKNFGGWKTRFFVLRGPVLEYFDMKDGHHLGSISLTNAQIGRQQAQEKSQDANNESNGSTDPNSYRHAFLILEPKKGQTVIDAKKNPGNVLRHVLCAETDDERDSWVDALMRYVGKEPSESTEGDNKEKSGRRIPEIQKLGATPIKELASNKGNEKLLLNQEAYERQQRSIPSSGSSQQLQSGRGGPQSPTDDRHSSERQSAEGQYTPGSRGNNNYKNNDLSQYPSQQGHHQQQPLPRNPSSQSIPQDDPSYKSSPEGQQGSSPYLSTADSAEKKQKSRMTFWPKKATKDDGVPQVPSTSGQQNTSQTSGTQGQQDSSRLRNFLGKGGNSSNSAVNVPPPAPQPPSGGGSYPSLAPIRQVFAVPLEQAIEQAQVQPGYELPAVVYRCIEYLNAHRAKLEEGIYRLNGSSAVIKSLKERFNHDGDVPLLAHEEYYDIHAVAGLLKLFLRDLPSSVLTRELHKDFLQVIELPTRANRVDELTRLVASLPECNYTLLRALTAHLIEIVDNADINKMTARNVGIVFSPTLGIPAGVFSLLMSDFDQIFHTQDGRIMPLENSDAQLAPSSQGTQGGIGGGGGAASMDNNNGRIAGANEGDTSVEYLAA
ncbi:hypothetical protein BG004_006858 [Podila humilis]|nr:hypothetical protein BG004_006858 [Podila humilis]